MPKANLVQTNFTAGEVSPTLYGRIDIERYKNGVREMTGFLPLIQGGAKSTPTRRFNAAAKFPDRKCRLIRFIFSKTEANMLEFGHGYIRFFSQDRSAILDGGVPYEIATVYDESELFEIEYVGNADTVLLFHENHPVQRLRRFGVDNWVIDDAPFDPQPFFEQGHRPAEDLTLSDASIGAARTVTASGDAFLDADVGRRIIYIGGVALITAYTSTTEVIATIESAFDSTSIPASEWVLSGTPQAECAPSSNGEVGESITLTLGEGVSYGEAKTLLNGSILGNTITFVTEAPHNYSAGNTVDVQGCSPPQYNGVYEIIGTPFPVDIEVTYGPDPGAMVTPGIVREVISGSETIGWRPEDVGAYVQINGGLLVITNYISGSTVDARVVRMMTSDVPSQAGAWILNQGIWNEENGYPRCGAFFQQSLVIGGSPAFPHTVAKSAIGLPFSFELGVNDDDAFLYTLDVSEFDPILHMAKVGSQLLVLTSGSEYTLTGGVETPMTPTNTQVNSPSDYGCNSVKPLRVDNDIVFINRTGRKYRALGYELQRDSFASPDLTKLSEHITVSGIVDMSYQQEPESIIWAVRNDGTMVTMCIDRAEGILAFSRQVPTAGTSYESVEVIPGDDFLDEVWCVVNTGSGRYIESFDRQTPYGLVSAVSESANPAKTTFEGLDHLEGQTVEIVGDDIIMAPQVVKDGAVTVEREVSEFYAGLSSHGFIKTLRPEMVTQSGSIQGNNTRIGQVTLRVVNTRALKINGANGTQYIDAREFGSNLLDKAPPEFEGDARALTLGWSKDSNTTIQQANALPAHLLAIIIEITANNQ